jgi:hypothetical protein
MERERERESFVHGIRWWVHGQLEERVACRKRAGPISDGNKEPPVRTYKRGVAAVNGSILSIVGGFVLAECKRSCSSNGGRIGGDDQKSMEHNGSLLFTGRKPPFPTR